MFKRSLVLALAFGLALPALAPVAEAAKSKRDSMTNAQKKKLRQQARDYCLKHYAKGTTYLERVEIQSNGKVICWMRG